MMKKGRKPEYPEKNPYNKLQKKKKEKTGWCVDCSEEASLCCVKKNGPLIPTAVSD